MFGGKWKLTCSAMEENGIAILKEMSPALIHRALDMCPR